MSDSGLTTSGVTPSTGNPEWFICNVICMFDFESDDPHHLSFSRNEILTVVKMEESGWWAAMRPRGDRLGWIPSSFVERLTESATEPDKQDDDTRIHDFEASNTRISEAETDSDGVQLEELLTSGLDVVKVSPNSFNMSLWLMLKPSGRCHPVINWPKGVCRLQEGTAFTMTLSLAYLMMSRRHIHPSIHLLRPTCHNPIQAFIL